MTKRKMKIMSSKTMRIVPTRVMPSKISELTRNLVHDIVKDLSNKKEVEGRHPKMTSL
jgi:hypothetical protein